MLLACPACNARFRVSPEALGEGREVRCAKCTNLWHAMPADLFEEGASPATTPRSTRVPFKVEPAAAAPSLRIPEAPRTEAVTPMVDAEPDFAAIEAAMARPRAPRAPRSISVPPKPMRTNPRPFMAAAAALVLLNLVVGLFLLRDPILKHVPAADGLYSALGYGDTRGLKLSEVRLVQSGEGKEMAFDLSGKIYNTSDRTKPVPMVSASLENAAGTVLKAWQFQADETMAPGSMQEFSNPEDKKLTSMYAGKADFFHLRLGSPRELDLRE